MAWSGAPTASSTTAPYELTFLPSGLLPGRSYRIEIVAAAYRDLAGNALDGIGGGHWNFVTAATAPRLIGDLALVAAAAGTTTVTDTLPSGLSFVSGSGTGWTCGAVGQDVTCTHAGPIASGGALPDLTLSVAVAANAGASLTNTAAVANATFDNLSTNNSSSDPTTVVQLPDVLVLKSLAVVSDPVNGAAQPKAIPGATVQYAVVVTNQGSGSPDVDSLLVADPIPLELEMFVNGLGGPSPVQFVDGATSSALALVFGGLGAAGDDLEFDDGSNAWTYAPTPGPDGFDPAVRGVRVRPSGTLAGAGPAATPSFELRFRARVK